MIKQKNYLYFQPFISKYDNERIKINQNDYYKKKTEFNMVRRDTTFKCIVSKYK